jgi:hypothetical protein
MRLDPSSGWLPGSASAEELLSNPWILHKLSRALAIFGSPLKHLAHQLQQLFLVWALQACLQVF